MRPLILFFVMLLTLAGCSECEDKHTLTMYETQITKEIDTQWKLSDELGKSPDEARRVVLTALALASLQREKALRDQVAKLRKDSGCL